MQPITYRDIAESAALLSNQASHIVEAEQPPTSESLYDYASLSRRRLKVWCGAVSDECGGAGTEGMRQRLLGLAEEVLVAELPVRVCAAVLTARDARQGGHRCSPFARHALLDVLQAKQNVLSRVLNAPQPLGALLRLNRLRRRTERWIDLLLANRALGGAGREFAIEEARWERFRDEAASGESLTSQRLLVVSLRQAMPLGNVEDPERARLHRELQRLQLGLLPAAAFGSDGQMRSSMLRRLSVGRAADTAVRPSRRLRMDRGHAAIEIVRRRYRALDPSGDDGGD